MEAIENNELISVIIPVYNVAEYLEQCLESVCNQTYRNLEIILVDDGSTDGSGEICDIWGRKDSRIIVIHKKNGGVSSAYYRSRCRLLRILRLSIWRRGTSAEGYKSTSCLQFTGCNNRDI